VHRALLINPKSGNLNLQEPSGPVIACTRIGLLLLVCICSYTLVKGKVLPVNAVKAYRRTTGISAHS
jgi:hypothetical protein